MKTQFHIQLDTDLKERLKRLHDLSGVPMAELMRRCVREHLPVLEEQHAPIEQRENDRRRARR
jgi:predicted transcriptional regulator